MFDVKPIAGALGAEVHGVDVKALNQAEFAELRRLWNEHLVLFLPGQSLTPEEHRRFADRFGEVDAEPFVYPFKAPTVEGHPEILKILKEASDRTINFGGLWHADVTYRERPHMAGIIYTIEAPEAGGDTAFANQYLAYETLSDGIKARLASLKAVHSNEMPYGGGEARIGAVGRGHAPAEDDRKVENNPYGASTNARLIETAHPVVRTHPETGRKFLFVNRAFVDRFEGWTREESLPLLEFLWAHAVRPEFTCRYRWTSGTLGFWDNRSAQHFALNDYYGQRRHMHRIAVHGERPA